MNQYVRVGNLSPHATQTELMASQAGTRASVVKRFLENNFPNIFGHFPNPYGKSTFSRYCCRIPNNPNLNLSKLAAIARTKHCFFRIPSLVKHYIFTVDFSNSPTTNQFSSPLEVSKLGIPLLSKQLEMDVLVRTWTDTHHEACIGLKKNRCEMH